jgi:hypothetical protein
VRANEDVPELVTLANTIARTLGNEIVTAVLIPANQRRRVRIARTRGTRRLSARTVAPKRRECKQKQYHG